MYHGKKKRMSKGGNPRQPMMYGKMPRQRKGHGGKVKMEGSQPKYKGTPKCMPN